MLVTYGPALSYVSVSLLPAAFDQTAPHCSRPALHPVGQKADHPPLSREPGARSSKGVSGIQQQDCRCQSKGFHGRTVLSKLAARHRPGPAKYHRGQILDGGGVACIP